MLRNVPASCCVTGFGLLGMSALERFSFTINNGLMVLSPESWAGRSPHSRTVEASCPLCPSRESDFAPAFATRKMINVACQVIITFIAVDPRSRDSAKRVYATGHAPAEARAATNKCLAQRNKKTLCGCDIWPSVGSGWLPNAAG